MFLYLCSIFFGCRSLSKKYLNDIDMLEHAKNHHGASVFQAMSSFAFTYKRCYIIFKSLLKTFVESLLKCKMYTLLEFIGEIAWSLAWPRGAQLKYSLVLAVLFFCPYLSGGEYGNME
jgi:hypothetical protein